MKRVGRCNLQLSLFASQPLQLGNCVSGTFDSDQVLQFSFDSLKNGLNLQCRFDAASVRLASALIAPVAPVLLLVSCLAVEVYNGSGIRAALKAGLSGVDVRFEHAGIEVLCLL